VSIYEGKIRKANEDLDAVDRDSLTPCAGKVKGNIIAHSRLDRTGTCIGYDGYQEV
jgi:hypothetical protein